jgi:hypothetical protein
MAITTLSMVLTVFVLNLHHINDRPVPAWLKTLMLHYLARLMCMCQFIPRTDLPDPEQDSDGSEKRNKYRVTPNSLGNAVGNQIGLLASLNGTLGMRNSSSHSHRSASRQPENSRHGDNFRSHYTFAEENPRKIKDLKMKEEEWSKDWRHLAEVVDRMFFWLFLSAIVITTLLLFHPLTKTYFSILGDEAILGEKKLRP